MSSCRLSAWRSKRTLLAVLCLCSTSLYVHFLTGNRYQWTVRDLSKDPTFHPKNKRLPLRLGDPADFEQDDSMVIRQTNELNVHTHSENGTNRIEISNATERLTYRRGQELNTSSVGTPPDNGDIPVKSSKDSALNNPSVAPETKASHEINFKAFAAKAVPHRILDEKTILVLFTTFKGSLDRKYPQSQIVLNWAQYWPWVQPVLYSPDNHSFLVDLALKNGWDVHSEQGANKYGTPLLKSMFKHALEHYSCSFFGYANGDILFDSGLVDTIKFIHTKRLVLNNTMVVGRRWNFPFYKYNMTRLGDIWPSNRVVQTRKKSSLFSRDAEDYFLTTRDYPWHKIKDVVIGRPGYDNYLVSTSIKQNVSTVDATNTINAVHITLNGSIFAGARNVDSHYNKNLIGRFNYNSGLTSSTRFATSWNKATGGVELKQRWDPVQKAEKEKQEKLKKEMEKKKKEEEKAKKKENKQTG